MKKRKKQPSTGKQIRLWMIKAEIHQVDIAKQLEITESAVAHFINGNFPSQRIRDFFVAAGCPESLMTALDRMRRNKQKKRRAA